MRNLEDLTGKDIEQELAKEGIVEAKNNNKVFSTKDMMELANGDENKAKRLAEAMTTLAQLTQDGVIAVSNLSNKPSTKGNAICSYYAYGSMTFSEMIANHILEQLIRNGYELGQIGGFRNG